MAGVKHDQGKPRWELLPFAAIEEVVKVLTHGAKRYGDSNWQLVQPWDHRYFGAALRHLAAYHRGEKQDPDTGLHHLAHAACCVLFLLWHELNQTPIEEAKSE